MESANVAARALGNLGHGFLAGHQQAIDNQLRAAPLEQQKKEFEANAPGRAADVAYKQAATQDIQSNQGLKPTPDAAQARYAAETSRIGAETEQAKAGALQSKAATARSEALLPKELDLLTGQIQEAGARGEAAAFENTPGQRRLRTLKDEAQTRLTVEQAKNIPFIQAIERSKLAIDQERVKNDAEQNRSAIRFNESQLGLKAQELAMSIQEKQSQTLEKLFVADNASKDREANIMAGLATAAIQNRGVDTVTALQQASQGMTQFMKMNRAFGDPSRFASLNATAQEAVSKMMSGVNDPNVDFNQKLKLISDASAASGSVLNSLLLPAQPNGSETKPSGGRPLQSKAALRKSQLVSQAGGGPASDAAAQEQLQREGLNDIRVNGEPVTPIPSYTMSGQEHFSYEFEKWAAANPQKLDEAFARYRVRYGSKDQDTQTAFEDFQRWLVGKATSAYQDTNRKSPQYGDAEGLFRTFSSYALGELRR